MTTALVPQQGGGLATVDILADFDKFLRLHTADGDASPATLRSYHSNAGQSAAWCAEHGINPATATEDDIAAYRKALVAQYATGTVAVKQRSDDFIGCRVAGVASGQPGCRVGSIQGQDGAGRAESSFHWMACGDCWTLQQATIRRRIGTGRYWP